MIIFSVLRNADLIKPADTIPCLGFSLTGRHCTRHSIPLVHTLSALLVYY
jgi:hypothetical protein